MVKGKLVTYLCPAKLHEYDIMTPAGVMKEEIFLAYLGKATDRFSIIVHTYCLLAVDNIKGIKNIWRKIV